MENNPESRNAKRNDIAVIPSATGDSALCRAEGGSERFRWVLIRLAGWRRNNDGG
jgi:hypothetical protein